jgi:hypothetical protein
MSEQSSEQHRSELVKKIPAGYSYVFHMFMTFGMCVSIITYALVNIVESQEPWTWWVFLNTFGVTAVYANMFEFHLHRDLFHNNKLTGILSEFFTRHNTHHQMFYEAPDTEPPDSRSKMIIRSKDEIYNVLMPWWSILLFFFVASGGSLLIAKVTGSAIIGWISLFSQGLYVCLYEGLHLSYHLSKKNRVFLWLSRRHFTHHHRSKQQYNMNITWSLWDRIKGTLYQEQK